MTENTNQNITVFVAGNPDASAGESTLLNINNSPLKSNDLGKTFYESITSDYYIELVHEIDFISYTYVLNPAKVHSAGSNRPGMFWIGVTVPRGKQISNPYNLIIELRDKFQALYMNKLSDGSYEFKNVNYSADEFRKIVERHEKTLGNFSFPYIEMTKNSKLGAVTLKSYNRDIVFENMLREFLVDTQYPVFKDYASIIVAKDICNVPVINIEVPMLRDFYVVSRDGATLRSSNNSNVINMKNPIFTGFLHKDDFHENINVTFDLNKITEVNNNLDTPFELILELDKVYVKGNFKPKSFKVGISIYSDGIDIKEALDSFDFINRNGEKCEVKHDVGFGYYLEFIGKDIDNEITIRKRNAKDVYDYIIPNPHISKSIQTIIINVIAFKHIEICNVPQNDENKKLYLTIGDKECGFKVGQTHNNGRCCLDLKTIAKEFGSTDFNQDDIKGCRYESVSCTADSYKESYKYEGGVLTIRLNERKENAKAPLQTSCPVKDEDNKERYFLRIYNEIDDSTIHLKEIKVNDKTIDAKEIKIINKKANYNSKRGANKNTKIQENKNYRDVEIDYNDSIDYRIEIVKLEKKGTKNDKKNKSVKIRPIEGEVNKFEYDNDNVKYCKVKINNDDIKNETWWDTITSKFRLKEKDTKFNGGTQTEKPMFKCVLRCFLACIIFLIFGFVLGLITEDKHDFLHIKDGSGGTEKVENFSKKCSYYENLLKDCGSELTLGKVDTIFMWKDTIQRMNQAAGESDKFASEEFKNITTHIENYKYVADAIRNKNFDSIANNDFSDNFYRKLKKNITPLLGRDDDSKIFMELIKNGKIDFNVNSFASIPKLYGESNDMIGNEKNRKKQENENLERINKLHNTCKTYYNLMKDCGEEFTFDKVDEIYGWVADNKNNIDINNNENYITIAKFISYYSTAADAIRGIDKRWTTPQWFEHVNSEYLYDCFMGNTPKDDFNNNFRKHITKLLGGNMICIFTSVNNALDLIDCRDTIPYEQIEFMVKMVKEVNHIEDKDSLQVDKEYLKISKGLYYGINDLLQKEINSFYDLSSVSNNK